MRFFVEGLIQPFVQQNQCLRLCEIGAHRGEATRRLLAIPNVSIDTIDPTIHEDLEATLSSESRVTMRRGLSLEILPQLNEAFDCILIDGDHNWYTVFHELTTIDQRGLLRPGGVIFMHDVRWPYARRDMYYDPSTLPAEFIHPYERKEVVRGRSALSSDKGNQSNLNNAKFEGGPRNGVLTGIEDFLQDKRGKYIFMTSPVEYGLGAIIYRSPDTDLKYELKWRLKLLAFAAKMRLRALKYRTAYVLEGRFPSAYRALDRWRR